MSTSLRFLVTALLLLMAGIAPAGADEPTVFCDGKPATIIGTAGNDNLTGTDADDVIVGLGGKDKLNGGSGNDTICGFDGADIIVGGPGDDVLLGGRGSDWLEYRSVDRPIVVDLGAGTAEGYGNDTVRSIENVWSSEPHNEIYGSNAPNIIQSYGGDKDVVWGRGGDDVLDAGRRFAEVRGGPGDDHLISGRYSAPGKAIMDGGPGNDFIESGTNATVTGGAGDDHIRVKAEWALIHPGGGDDIVDVVEGVAAVSYWHAPGPVDVDLVAGTATGWGSDQLTGVSEVRGTRYDDTMRGAPSGGEFRGLGGDDILEAADTSGLRGSLLSGGRGSDVLRGSGGRDGLSGGPGKDVLIGLGGPDDLAGGEGHDEIDGGTGDDTIHFSDLPGPMVINLSTSKVFGPGADDIVSIESATGSRGDDVMTGSVGVNFLDGRGGNDTLYGRGGNDLLQGWLGNDTMYGGYGNDTMLGNYGSNVLRGGAGSDDLYGGKGNGQIFGGPGSDSLDGESGTHDLDGGADEDICTHGATYISCEVIL